MKKIIFFLFLLSVLSCAHQSEKADLIIHNAKIYSMDEKNTVYEAMAVKDGKVMELGAERQILNKYSATEKYDAKKRSVYPGFIDAHGHILSYGQSLLNIDLTGTSSFEEIISILEKKKTTNEKLITGRGWDQNDWEIKEFPSNEKINELFPDVPVILYRVDGHAAIVNQKTLDLAGVNENSQITGGEFVSKNGKLTGVLIDNAIDKVTQVLPVTSPEQIEKALLTAHHELVKFGLTTIDDAGMEKSTLDMLRKLQEEGKFKIRVYAMIMGTQENLLHYTKAGPEKNEMLNVSSFKFLADGALGSRGACLKEPYHDVPDKLHYGAMLVDSVFLHDAAALLYETGFQMNTHCIGDSANKILLSIYAGILKDMNDKRWRIEHAQVMDPSDFKLFSTYSILPSVQPTHAISDMPWAESRVGSTRIKSAYAYKTLLMEGKKIALGTDFPVESPDPLKTFYAAVFRKDKEGKPANGFQPEESLTREEALRGMTIWAAYANFEENMKGSLEKGKLADFVILSNDLLTMPESAFKRLFVVRTYINGEQVYAYE